MGISSVDDFEQVESLHKIHIKNTYFRSLNSLLSSPYSLLLSFSDVSLSFTHALFNPSYISFVYIVAFNLKNRYLIAYRFFNLFFEAQLIQACFSRGFWTFCLKTMSRKPFEKAYQERLGWHTLQVQVWPYQSRVIHASYHKKPSGLNRDTDTNTLLKHTDSHKYIRPTTSTDK